MAHRKLRKGEMQRSLFLGISESGKSCLAKARALRQIKEGYAVLVFTPNLPPVEHWPCRWQTDDPEEFMRAFWNNKGCVFYIDEAASDFFGAEGTPEQLKRWRKELPRVSTRGRHLLHEVNIITQHFRSIEPKIREQHTHVYCCTQGKPSCEALVEERADALFMEALSLPVGEFIYKPGNMAKAERRTFDLAAYCQRFPEFRRYA